MYYRSLTTGKIFFERKLRILEDIYGEKAIENYCASGILEPIKEPDVIDCIRADSLPVAVYRYRTLHPETSVKDAWSMIFMMRKDLERMNKK